MAGVDFRVIFEEEEGRTAPGSPAPGDHQNSDADLPAGPESAEPITGPARNSQGRPSAADALSSLGMIGANFLGFGGIASTATRVTSALMELYRAIHANTEAHEEQAELPRTEILETSINPAAPRGSTAVNGPQSANEYNSRLSRLNELHGPDRSNWPETARSEMDLPTGRIPSVNPGMPVVGPAHDAAGYEAWLQTLPTAAEETAEMLGLVAVAAAPFIAAMAAATAAVVGFNAIMRVSTVVHNEGERIQGYSAELSEAHAMSALRSELADIRRANRIGPAAAEAETMRSKVQSELADVQTEIYKAVAEMLAALKPFLPLVIGALEMVKSGVELTVKEVQIVEATLIAMVQIMERHDPLFRGMSGHLRKLADKVEEDREDEEDPFMAGMLARFGAAMGEESPRALPTALRAAPGGGFMEGGAGGRGKGRGFGAPGFGV